MSSKFNAAIHQKDDVTFVKLSGVIDEDNELGPLADKLATSTAVIDLSEIDRINSCGVRDWVNWLSKVEKQGASNVVFVECSPSIIAQINLVSNFTGSGTVKSFYAPYFCPNCDREKVLLVETRDLAGKGPYKAPTCRCDECDGPMDFDDMEDSFFAFLGNAKKVSNDAAVEAAVSEFSPSTSSDRKLRLRTNVSGVSSNPGAAPIGGGTLTPAQSGATNAVSLKTGNTGGFTKFTNPGSNPGTSGSGQKWPLSNDGDLSAPRRLAPPPPEPRSAGAWILVGVLVAAAIALLAYVFVSAPKATHMAVPAAGSDTAPTNKK